MTTGQRIAQKRKELGLSQEALGEKLSVSRQSIYKWESDSALPEIEKLVVLSRLFGVSVGWLLGAEEESAPGSGELTGEQLKLVEEIAARYVPRPWLSPRRIAVVKVSAVVAALCLCGVLWGFYRRLEDLTRNYTYLQTTIAQVQDGVNGQIEGVSDRVETLLREQNAVTADYGVSLESVNLAGSNARFHAYAVPKRFVEGMTAVFYDYQGRPRQNARQFGQRFEADLVCGLAEEITISVDFAYPDGTRQTQVLERFAGLYGQIFPEVEIQCNFLGKKLEDGVLALSGEERIVIDWARPPEGSLPKAELKSVQVGLFKDKKLIDWAVFGSIPGVIEEETTILTGEQWKNLDILRQSGENGTKSYQLLDAALPPRKVPLEAGDVLQAAVVLRDVYGRTAIRSGVAFGLDEGWKELTSLDLDTSDAYPGGWMLQDGSSICS